MNILLDEHKVILIDLIKSKIDFILIGGVLMIVSGILYAIYRRTQSAYVNFGRQV